MVVCLGYIFREIQNTDRLTVLFAKLKANKLLKDSLIDWYIIQQRYSTCLNS